MLDGLVTGTLSEIDKALDLRTGRQAARNPSDERRLTRRGRSRGGRRPGEDGAELPDAKSAARRTCSTACSTRACCRATPSRPTSSASTSSIATTRSRSTPSSATRRARVCRSRSAQYAPGKVVWIDNKEWTSGAIYSPMHKERFQAWRDKMLYFECQVCHYAKHVPYEQAERGEERDCEACGAVGKFGKAMNWMRPPGFAHRVNEDPGTSPDDAPANSYATRAKLVAEGPQEEEAWDHVTDRLEQTYRRDTLLVTNTGPRSEGYTYCTRCGLIEPTKGATGVVVGTHPKPYPDEREPDCQGSASTRGLVLGTDFISDVLLVRLKVDKPITLRPELLSSQVALRTIAEALTIAATGELDVDASELQAEYRPALTPAGSHGLEAEIYLYDTLAGGAGFTRRVHDYGLAIFKKALERLETCPADCDASCYRCLRSFRNRFEHGLLDRKIGAALLKYVLDGTKPCSGRRPGRPVDRQAAGRPSKPRDRWH